MFQCERNFLFWGLAWKFQQRSGVISYLADKSGLSPNNEPFLTVEAATEFLRLSKNGEPASPLMSHAKLMYLLSRIKPYAKELPGTSLYMKQEQRHLLSMINSPVTLRNGNWNWFFTNVLDDLNSKLLQDNLVTSSQFLSTPRLISFRSEVATRRQVADTLTNSERAQLVRQFPAISARVFMLHQEAMFNIIFQGRDQPLGEISDFWRRVEFQARGTPHSHNLICTTKNGILETDVKLPEKANAEDIRKLSCLCDFVSTVITARVQPRAKDDISDLPSDQTEHEEHLSNESKFSYKFQRSLYKHNNHPGTERFTSNRDYSYDKFTDKIVDPRVQKHYRRQQLFNQTHDCRFTCFKYCKPGDPRHCRFRFPKDNFKGNDTRTVIVTGTDHRNKQRILVEPPRNNQYLAQHIKSPLAMAAIGANNDLAKIDKATGSAVYASAYSSKADKPDNYALQNAISRKLALAITSAAVVSHFTDKQLLRKVSIALTQATVVGAVQAAHILLDLPLVISSRVNVNLNALIRKEIDMHTIITDETALNEMDPDSDATNKSPTCQLGRRDAYYTLYCILIKLYGVCRITFAAYLMTYRTEVNKSKAAKVDPPDLIVDRSGAITNAVTFVIQQVTVTGTYIINVTVTLYVMVAATITVLLLCNAIPCHFTAMLYCVLLLLYCYAIPRLITVMLLCYTLS